MYKNIPDFSGLEVMVSQHSDVLIRTHQLTKKRFDVLNETTLRLE